jgi:hypothetical protein
MRSSRVHDFVIRRHNHTFSFKITDHFLNDLICLFPLTRKYHGDTSPMLLSLDPPYLPPGIKHDRDRMAHTLMVSAQIL